jgi:hypothetical protein
VKSEDGSGVVRVGVKREPLSSSDMVSGSEDGAAAASDSSPLGQAGTTGGASNKHLPSRRDSGVGGGVRVAAPASASGGGSGDCGGLLFQIKWFRVVLDEAQSIKNPRTLAAAAVGALCAEHRWCLSGTPIQNSVGAVYYTC